MILVTAFEPFGGKTWNSSLEIMNSLSGVDKTILPVSITGCKEAIDALDIRKYDTIVMLGEADRSYLSLEQFAYNEINMRIPDNSGIQLKNQTIDEGVTQKTPYDLNKWVKDDVKISVDPGRYLCNYAYYLLLRQHPKVLFIHVSNQKQYIAHQSKQVEEIIYEIKTISITR